jgi:hypothetical protein
MARVTLKVQGIAGEISLESFLLALGESFSILRELDRAVSRQRHGTLKWVVSGLREGSAVVEAESRVIHGEEDFGLQVAERFVDGIRTLQDEGVTPPLFSQDCIRSLRKIARSFGTNGVSGLEITAPDLDQAPEPVKLSSETSTKLGSLIGVRRKSIGSVEGNLELISVHPRSRRFNVYHSVTQKAIKCNLSKEIEAQVIDSLGRRVIVSGVVSRNALGEPISVDVHRLRVLKDERDLPSIREMVGMALDMTGELTTEEYIRTLRDG